MDIGDLRVVDLTQPIHPDVVMWPGAPGPVFEVVGTIVPDGFYNRRVTFLEHSGTHFDAPAHMVEGAALLHQIDPTTLIRPAVVIDISEAGTADADWVLTPGQVAQFETANGRIARGSVVLLRTGWDAYNSDVDRYGAGSGSLRFPGFGPDATRILVDERGVVGLGIDTMSIDPGNSADLVVHRTVSHPRGLWHLEGLQNLAALPPVGAWIFVGVLNLVDGSGSPARVLALVP